jgi:hypothetical protein
MYAALSPTKIATYVTMEDFQHFWQTVRECTGSSYSGLHFGHYMLLLSVRTYPSCMLPN